MSNSHLKTAHAWGVQQALEQVGYTSVEDVYKEAAALGIVEAPAKTASPASPSIDELFRNRR